MKTYMLLNGLRWSRNSGSILCNTLKKWCFRTGWGGKTEIATRPEIVSIPKIPDKASITFITFRNKHQGWKSYRMEIKMK